MERHRPKGFLVLPVLIIMYAIQWGLIISALISSITGISGVANTPATLERFFGPSYPTGALFTWNFKMQFMSLLVVYSLNFFVAIWCPFTTLGYMLGAGNMVRVAYIFFVYMIDAEKMAHLGMQENGKMLKVICAIQTVLAVVIFGCTYVSSTNVEYNSFADGLAASAVSADFGAFTYFVYVFAGIGILGRIPQLINPKAGMARFMKDGEAGLPSDKGEITMLEFSVGFTAVNFLLVWTFTLSILFYTPTSVPIALFLLAISLMFIPFIASTIIGAAETGFALPPMLFFLILISTNFGAALMELF